MLCNFQGSQQPELFDAAEYCNHAIFSGISVSSIPLPPKYEFQDFPFQVQDYTLAHTQNNVYTSVLMWNTYYY